MSGRVRRYTLAPEPRAAETARIVSGSVSPAAAEREDFFRSVLDGFEVGAVMTTLDEEIVFVNRAARALLKMSSVEPCALGSLFGLPVSLENLVAAGGTTTHLLPTVAGDALELELRIHRAEQRGIPIGYFVFVRDVREERERSVERARLERLAAIGTMVAGFAHEVRNPVAALRSLAESLEEDLSDANIHVPYVSRMLQVIERVERLVRTSLQFGRPSAPRRALHRPWTIVAGALGELAPRSPSVQRELRLSIDPDLPDVYVDHDQMIQVLVILINNAIEAVGSAKGVLIRVTGARRPSERPSPGVVPPQAAEGVRFSVVDDGPGIPAELLDRIFDPFFTTKSAGTGLGLSIAHHVVSENGGSIVVTSTRGSSTTFTVTVPCADTTGR